MKHSHSSNINRNAPQSLKDEPFYGLLLDEEQEKFRDALWDKDKLIVFCNSKAGTGKTTIALGTANLLYSYGMYREVIYIVSPTQEQIQGFLPGDQEQKTAPYMGPLLDAMSVLGLDAGKSLISDTNIQAQKEGTAFIRFMPHTYLRGCNFDNAVVIIEEAQNFYGDSLKKVLTRIHDNCKVVVIGHTGQIDILKHPERSGFAKYLDHFKDDHRCEVVTLTQNHRGWISSHADELEF